MSYKKSLELIVDTNAKRNQSDGVDHKWFKNKRMKFYLSLVVIIDDLFMAKVAVCRRKYIYGRKYFYFCFYDQSIRLKDLHAW